MMAKKTNSTEWEEYQRTSKAVRKRVDDLILRTGQLAESNDTDPINVQRVLDAEKAGWEETNTKFRDEIDRSRSVVSPRRDAMIEELADALKRRLETGGHTVFGESQTMVVDGIVHIGLDVQAGRVKINGKDHRNLRTESIAAATKVVNEELKKQVSEPDVFKKQLLQSYEYLISTTKARFSSQVKTLDLLPVVAFQRQEQRFLKDPRASNYSDYPATLFRADLHNLLASGSLTTGDFSFRWASGSTTNGAVFMYIPPLQRTGHLGRVWFDKLREGESHA